MHQGWLTTDRSFLIIDDERDQTGEGIRTFIADVRDLDTPRLAHIHVALGETFGDHNQYVLPIGDHDYTIQANYAGGIRALRINRGSVKGRTDDEILSLEEVGYFDTNPKNNNEMDGVWSAWVYFDDLVITNDMDTGFYVLRRTFTDSTQAIKYAGGKATKPPTVWADCPKFKDSKSCRDKVACNWSIDWQTVVGWKWACYNYPPVLPTRPFRAPGGSASNCDGQSKDKCNIYPACIMKSGRCTSVDV